ncbi:MAG: hypothetical protein WD768_11220 [Phycisphaeraceae bacterium]
MSDYPQEPESPLPPKADSAPASQANAPASALHRARELFDSQFTQLESQWKEVEAHRAENVRRQERLEKKALALEGQRVLYTKRQNQLNGKRLQIDNERRAMEQRVAELEAGERDLGGRKASAAAAEKELADRLRDMEAQRQALTAESLRIEKAQAEINVDRERLKDIERRADQLDLHETQLKQTAADVSQRETVLKDARKTLDESQVAFKSQQQELDKARVAVESQRVQLVAQQNALEAATGELGATRQRLDGEEAALTERVAAYEKDRAAMEADRAELREQAAALESRQTELAVKWSAFDAEAAAQKARGDSLQKEEAAHRQAVARLKESRDKLVRQQQAFDQTAAQVFEEKLDLDQQKESLDRRRKALDSRQQELDERAKRLANEDMKGRALAEYDRLQVELGRIKHKREELKEVADRVSRHDQRVRHVDSLQRRRNSRMKKLRELLSAKLREIRSRSRDYQTVGPGADGGSWELMPDEKLLGDGESEFHDLVDDEPQGPADSEANVATVEPVIDSVPLKSSVAAPPLASPVDAVSPAAAPVPAAKREAGPSAFSKMASTSAWLLSQGAAKAGKFAAKATRGAGSLSKAWLRRMAVVPSALGRAWGAFMRLSLKTRAVGVSIIALGVAAWLGLCVAVAHLSIDPVYRASVVLNHPSPTASETILSDAVLGQAIDLLSQRGLKPFESVSSMREKLSASLNVESQTEGRVTLRLDSPRREEAVFILEAVSRSIVQHSDASTTGLAIASAAPLTPLRDERWSSAIMWFVVSALIAAAVCLLPLLVVKKAEEEKVAETVTSEPVAESRT